jgi:hypothetical protein
LIRLGFALIVIGTLLAISAGVSTGMLIYSTGHHPGLLIATITGYAIAFISVNVGNVVRVWAIRQKI